MVELWSVPNIVAPPDGLKYGGCLAGSWCGNGCDRHMDSRVNNFFPLHN